MIRQNCCGNKVQKVSAGTSCCIYLYTDGALKATGADIAGERLSTLIPAGTYIDISAGYFQIAAIASDGHIEQFGNPGEGFSTTPPAGAYTQVTSHKLYCAHFAIKSDQTIVGWSTQDTYDLIADIPAGSYTKISIGNDHAAAINTAGAIVTWGTGLDTDLGTIPSLPAGQTWIDVACGTGFTLGLSSAGKLYRLATWGGSTSLPAVITGYAQISVCKTTLAALHEDGYVVFWGDNTSHQNDLQSCQNQSIAQVSCGNEFNAVLYTSGNVMSLGYSTGGATLDYSQSLLSSWPNACFCQSVQSLTHTALLKKNGSVVFTGGANGAEYSYFPGPLPRVFGRIVKLFSGISGETIFGIDKAGRAYGWGLATAGQLTIPAGTYKHICCGGAWVVGIKFDNTLDAWGDAYNVTNILDDLPSGTYLDVDGNAGSAIAVKSDTSLIDWGAGDYGTIPAGSGYVKVKSGFRHAIFLKSDGSVECCGTGDPGAAHLQPPAVNSNIVQIAAGDDLNAVRYADGSVAVWGGTASLHGLDVYPTPNLCFVDISLHLATATAIDKNGVAHVWGADGYYQKDVGI